MRGSLTCLTFILFSIQFPAHSYCSQFESWQDRPRYTLDYAPPELLADPEVVTYSPAVDIYGLGATLYAMIVGHPPYRDGPEDVSNSYSAHSRLRERMEGGMFNRQASRWLNASETLQVLVGACLNTDPADRPSLDIILNCEWVVTEPEMEEAMMEVKQEPEEVEENEEAEEPEESEVLGEPMESEYEEEEDLATSEVQEEPEKVEKREEPEKLEVAEKPDETEEPEESELLEEPEPPIYQRLLTRFRTLP